MKIQRYLFIAILTAVVLLLLISTVRGQAAKLHTHIILLTTGTTTRVSKTLDGVQGNGNSSEVAISGDGRYIAFYSDADNLVADDMNGRRDIFVYDRQTGEIDLVSVSSGGLQANGESSTPSISADGRYVVFHSLANNLVDNDNNNSGDIFMHDRQTSETTLISVDSNGDQGNGDSYQPAISADGRYVAFCSLATNLIGTDDTNGYRDIFVRDRQTLQTTIVSVSSDGIQGNNRSTEPYISADGRFIAFSSEASTLVLDDNNGYKDVFVHDRQTLETTRVSVASNGDEGNGATYFYPSISANGRYVAFDSYATNLVDNDGNSKRDVFVHDRQTQETTLVSVSNGGLQGNWDSASPSISADGRYVAFYSHADNLIGDDTNNNTDAFVRDRLMETTIRISIASDGTQGNGTSWYPSISADGRYISFSSDANNLDLILNDTNGVWDVFVHDRGDIIAPSQIADLQAITGNAAGEVDLSWTAPGNDGNTGTAAAYTVRYADSEIVNELGWLNATDVDGEPTPQVAGTSQSMTVPELTPGQTYYFVIRAEDEAGNISDLSNSPSAMVKEGIDLGFRPNPDGYSFNNPGSSALSIVSPNCSDFQSTYSGLDIQCSNGLPQGKYSELYADFRSTFSTGICTGMAATSLLYFTGAATPPEDTSTYKLALAQARDNIAIYHGRQHSKAVMDEIVLPKWNEWQGNDSEISQEVDAVYQQIKTALYSGNTDPLVLNFYPRPNCGTEGHTVLPYRIDESDPLHPKVYIYENFAYGNESKYIQFDFASTTHRFNYWLWDSTACKTLIAVPVSAFTGTGGNVPTQKFNIKTGGNAQPLLVNSSGEQIGYENGILTTTLPNAMPIYPWYTPGVTSTVNAFLVPPDNYVATISNDSTYTFSIWSPAGALEFSSDSTNAVVQNSAQNTNDYISFSNDLQSTNLSTDNPLNQTVKLQMFQPYQTADQRYIVDNISLVPGSDLAVTVSDSKVNLQSNGLTTDYDISAVWDLAGTQPMFSHTNINILAEDIQVITFVYDNSALTAVLEIDHDGDGSIDETLELDNEVGNQDHQIFLPLIIR